MLEDTHSFWTDLLAATDGSALLRRLPNAEHSCAGHEISMFFTMRSFFLSCYEVNYLFLLFEFFSKLTNFNFRINLYQD